MRWVLEPDLQAFDARVRPLLEARIENNVVATVLSGTIEGQFRAAPVLAMGLDEHGAVAAAAMRTAPWPMLCTGLRPGDAEELLDIWLKRDPDLPGVNAPLETAHALAAAWARRTGGSTRCRTAMAMHSLQTVLNPPRPGPGRLVVATEAHRELALGWWNEFVDESHVIDAGPESRVVAVDSRIAHRHLWLWEDAGVAVSMVAVNPAVAGVVRIGPVYTPLDARRRGYATSAVAAISRQALQAGAHTCMLFTDLSNPTSNKIYADVGYRRFGEWEETAFTPGG
ncbi:MAG: GNAT family N-acetyltransferase [Solirubrobacteraceae bacterium]